MDELEELPMLIVRADPKYLNRFPFWIAEVGKIQKDWNSATFLELVIYNHSLSELVIYTGSRIPKRVQQRQLYTKLLV